MQKINKSKISLIKVIVICLILFVLSGAGVMALATTLSTVKIELANGYEMTVLTSKNNIKEILNDNNILDFSFTFRVWSNDCCNKFK